MYTQRIVFIVRPIPSFSMFHTEKAGNWPGDEAKYSYAWLIIGTPMYHCIGAWTHGLTVCSSQCVYVMYIGLTTITYRCIIE